MDFESDDAFKRAVNDFIKVEEITVPTGLNGKLRPYQERGFQVAIFKYNERIWILYG